MSKWPKQVIINQEEVRTSIHPPRLKSNTRRPLPEEKTVWPVFGINENLIQHKHIIGF